MRMRFLDAFEVMFVIFLLLDCFFYGEISQGTAFCYGISVALFYLKRRR